MSEEITSLEEKIDFSLILPCYNEMEILNKSIDSIINLIENTSIKKYEIIMIDDCSKDGTREELIKISKKYPCIKVILHQENVGRGGTVTEGLEMAIGKVVGFLDIDLEIPEWYILPAYMLIKKGADVVCANRVYNFKINKIGRFVLSKGYNRLMKIMLGVNFLDSEAGFKFFKKSSILKILGDMQDEKWFWDTEIMVRSYYAGLKIKNLPTLFIKKDDKTSTVKWFSDSVEYFKALKNFRPIAKSLKKNESI